jgi:hypothetical protein
MIIVRNIIGKVPTYGWYISHKDTQYGRDWGIWSAEQRFTVR